MDYSKWLDLWDKATPEQLIAPVFVFSLVTVLCLWYLLRYFVRSFALSRRLKKLTRQVRAIKELPPAKRRSELEQLFQEHTLGHAWQEYAETLHDQFEVREGEQRMLCSRATAGAGHFFTAQTVVETPLGTEFYKHLPGILTGIGIVGTFFGLMLGLQHFDPSTPEQVSSSVDQLLKDVLFAFLGSFFSIFASIGVTLTEKWRLGRCYKHLETLTESIDGLFDSGVGEEYLAELVKSSNESSIQTRQLKDSLVTDLREMLQNLVDTQVRENLKLADTLSASYRDSGQVLAERIGGAIENSLKSPLEAIAGAVNTASGDQSNQVQSLLTDVLTAFMSKLESTFGQQFNGLHEMLANLQASIARIGSEGEGAGERMAKQLEKLFADSEARQQAMAANLQAFVESMQQSMGQGQQETMAKIASSVDVLGEQLGGLFKQLEHNRTQMDQASKVAQVELHRGTREMVGGLEEQVKTLLDAVADQQGAMQDSLKLLGAQTEQHLQSMQQGAEKMRLAAERFDSAGQSVSKAGEATAGVLGALQGTSSDLVGASRELTSVVADYRNNREALNQTLGVIQGVVATTQGESAGRSQYLQDLKQQGERLQALNREVNDYLEQISAVLGKGFNEFSEGVDRSLRQTLGSLDAELHKAMTSLAGGVEGVKESLEDFSDIMERVQRR
ncbi:anti-phage defense ZorAB system ZorA [Pseudomonas aeruginosa]|nr:anti-phage defense ZorAB system ZorA [Pseudomonas aeruginosa]